MKTKEGIIEHIYDMNLQNLTEKTSFDRAFKQGIEDAVNDLIELNLLTIPVVVGQSEQLFCGDLIKHNFSLSKIGRCIICDREKDKAK